MTVSDPEEVLVPPLDVDAVRVLVKELVPELKAKRKRLKGVVEHLKFEKKTFAPRGQTPEHRYLDALTHTPWGAKLAATFAQELNVVNFRSPEQTDTTVNDPTWDLWDAARMDVMQDIVVREANRYGDSFVAALPTTDGKSLAKPLPPMQTVAKWEDPVVDVWPVAVLSTAADKKRATPSPGTLYVDDWVYLLDFPEGLDAETVTIKDAWQHYSPVTPVVRFACEIDSEGNTIGKIEPLLPLLERIRKDTYDRQMIQHKSSWKVRTATGLEPDEGSESTDQAKMRLAVEDVLVSSDPNVKFGTLDETPLDGLIAAKEADVFELCSLGQVPPSSVMPGKVSNISAETIAELRSSFENAVKDQQTIMGDAYRWLMQALAVQAGEVADPASRVVWEDRSSRSLAQAADAWSKIVPSLGVPEEGAWERLPGVSAADRAHWANMKKRAEGRATIAAIFGATQTPPAEPQPPAEPVPA